MYANLFIEILFETIQNWTGLIEKYSSYYNFINKMITL